MSQPGDLFGASGEVNVPLAERLRPKSVEEVVGQKQLLGEGRPLWVALRSGKPHSMILWVLAGVKEIREAVERAKLTRDQYGRSTIMFVDEVHRFNKSQQDAFLPHVESGLLTFIGATTENPSFEVNSALLSRATVHVLKPLDDDELGLLLERAAALLEGPPM